MVRTWGIKYIRKMDNISLYSNYAFSYIKLKKNSKAASIWCNISTTDLLQVDCVADLHLYIKGVKSMALLWAS